MILAVKTPLDKHVQKLVDMYSTQPEVPQDVWPPVLINTNIHLALIKQQGTSIYDAGEYACSTNKGDADDIFEDKERISYEEIFGNIDSGVRLLIEGCPGSGKTTLVHKVSQDWARGKIRFCHVRVLFLVHLRGFLNDANITLLDILKCYYNGDSAIQIEEYADKQSGLGMCFILDGLDEYLPREKATYIKKLIKRSELPQAVVIFTTHPAAAADFRSSTTTQVEVLGFQKEEVFDFINKYQFPVESKCLELHKYLDSHPNVCDMCYLPVHTAMVCYIDHFGESLPETETGIYKEFTTSVILRTLRRIEDVCIESLSASEKEIFMKICRLAFEMTKSLKPVLMEVEVEKVFDANSDRKDYLGLITVDKIAMRFGFPKLYGFLHQAFQEFLAAYYISNLEDNEQVTLIRKYFNAKQMKQVQKFYFGLVNFIDQKNVFEILVSQLWRGTLFKVHRSFESQQSSTCDSVAQGRSIFLKEESLSPLVSTAIAFVISTSQNTISELSFYKCSLTEEGLDILIERAEHKLSLVTVLCYHGYDCPTEQLRLINKLMHKLPLLEILDITYTKLFEEDKVKALTFNLNHSNLQVLKIGSPRPCQYSSNRIPPDLISSFTSKCSNFVNVWFADHYRKYATSSFSLPFYFHCVSNLSDINLSFNKLHLIEVKIIADNLKKNSVCERLSLIYCGIYDAGAIALAEGIKCISSIKILELNLNHIGKDGAIVLADSIKYCVSLCKLNLSGNEMGDDGALAIVHATKDFKACKLHMWNNNLTASGAAAVVQIKSDATLDTLDFKNRGIGNAGVSVVVFYLTQCCSVLSSLHVLDLAGNRIDDNGIKALAVVLKDCTNLLSLNLGSNRIENCGASVLGDSLKHCHHLHELNLDRNLIDDNGGISLLYGLEHCHDLITLDVEYNNFGEGWAKALGLFLKHSVNLHTLNIGHNSVGQDGAMGLFCIGVKGYSNIHSLNISYNGIRDSGAEALSEHLKCSSSLHELNLCGNFISDVGASHLLDVLIHCSFLHRLDLGNNNIGNIGINGLAKVTQCCSNLHTLYMSTNNLGRDGAEALARALKNCSNLQVLEISHNMFGEDGGSALAEGIEYCSDLRTLDISSNNIGAGSKALLTSMQKCSKLHTLDISNNQIGNDGAMALADNIIKNGQIHTLITSRNNIGKDGALAIARNLKRCSNFLKFDFNCNHIGDFALHALARKLKRSSTMKTLNFSHCDITSLGAEILIMAFMECNFCTLDLTGNRIYNEDAENFKYLRGSTKCDFYI